jgi:hypothetical protein
MSQPLTRPSKQRDSRRSVRSDNRTKFDKWLQRCADDKQEVTFIFSTDFASSRIGRTGLIIDVDRYMVLVEFNVDGECWWIQKSNIAAVSLST